MRPDGQTPTLRPSVGQLQRSPPVPRRGQTLRNLPKRLRRAIDELRGSKNTPGVLQNVMAESLATPYGAKANCYAHFLGLRSGIGNKGIMVRGALTNRDSKSQPGESCATSRSKDPLEFHDRAKASVQIIDRVLCDNPDKIFFMQPPYFDNTLRLRLPRGFHMGCAIVGGQDYHFLRREGIDVMLKNKLMRSVMTPAVRAQLEDAKRRGHHYVWSHVAGWSGRMKLTDARGKIILNPVPKKASGSNTEHMNPSGRADHHYPSLDYDTFAAFFIVKSRAASVDASRSKPVDVAAMRARLLELGIPRTLLNTRLPLNMRAMLSR